MRPSLLPLEPRPALPATAMSRFRPRRTQPSQAAAALLLGLALTLGVAACAETTEPGPAGLAAERFPRPQRPVAGIISDQWASEDSRERAGEADKVMDLLGVRPGLAVADIGAGAGYYVGGLSRRVGPTGRVIAQDVERRYLDGLRRRVAREGWNNVSFVLGAPHDPRLAPRSVDLALLVHMYHEIEQPFGLLHNLAPALRPGGRVAILDVDGPIRQHGTPRALLLCELAAVGFREVAWHWIEGRSIYLAVFEPPAQLPEPERITPCAAPR